MIDLKQIDNTWTLFLDRDGVINQEKKDDYIRNKEEFKFYERVKEATELLSGLFGTIVMVTEIIKAGGRLDRIYYSTGLDNTCEERKPNPGMAHLAKKQQYWDCFEKYRP
ncbi:MAG: family hydrolase [Chitinophagaceae bacterium]|nr:family hydrolase [Chitinophagaceae bacterium]